MAYAAKERKRGRRKKLRVEDAGEPIGMQALRSVNIAGRTEPDRRAPSGLALLLTSSIQPKAPRAVQASPPVRPVLLGA